MTRALLLLALLAGTARAQTPSDWFDPFRGREAFVVDDTSWVARGDGSPDAAPLRARHLILLFRSEGDDARLWERRHLLLVAMPDGGRWAAELAWVRPRRSDGSELLPHARVASRGGVLESWAAGSLPGGDKVDFSDPCAGERYALKGNDRLLRYHHADATTRTVKQAVAELRDRTFGEDEVRQLDQLRRLLIPEQLENERLAQARAAWGLLLMDRAGIPEEGATVVLAPDPDPPADLEEWRGLTWLPETFETMGLPDGL